MMMINYQTGLTYYWWWFWVVGSCDLVFGLVIQTHDSTNNRMCLIKIGGSPGCCD
jgi:hypothetical protein